MHNLFTIHSFAQGILLYGAGALAGSSFALIVFGLDAANKRVRN